MIPMMTMTDR